MHIIKIFTNAAAAVVSVILLPRVTTGVWPTLTHMLMCVFAIKHPTEKRSVNKIVVV